jgi:hypothetical protein
MLTEKILQLFQQSPIYTRLIAENETELETTRADALKELERENRDYLERRPALVAKCDDAVAKLRAAEAAVRAAYQKVASAQRTLGDLNAAHNRRVRDLRTTLAETAPEEIADVRRAVDVQRDRHRSVELIDAVRRADALAQSPLSRSEIREQLAALEELATRYENVSPGEPIDLTNLVARPPMFERVTAKVIGGSPRA